MQSLGASQAGPTPPAPTQARTTDSRPPTPSQSLPGFLAHTVVPGEGSAHPMSVGPDPRAPGMSPHDPWNRQKPPERCWLEWLPAGRLQRTGRAAFYKRIWLQGPRVLSGCAHSHTRSHTPHAHVNTSHSHTHTCHVLTLVCTCTCTLVLTPTLVHTQSHRGTSCSHALAATQLGTGFFPELKCHRATTAFPLR